MSSDISPESEQFIREVLATGAFHNRREALDTAVDLLRQRQQLIRDVNKGIEQLERGESKPLDMEEIKANVCAELKKRKGQPG